MNYRDKIVWITGASSGIGEALTYSFNSEGSHVIISARREDELVRVKKSCQFPDNVTIAVMDITDMETMPKIVEEMIQKHKTIDVLINNSGISQRSYIKETPLDIDRKVMEINFFGTINLTKLVLPVMLKNKSGQIAVTSSVVGKFGFPLRSAYSASKHALHGFFETLRAECHPDNIKVNIIIPGRISTNISLNAITKDGSRHGKMDGGQTHGISSESAAKTILKGLKKNRKEIHVGGKELLMVHIRRFLPFLFYKLATKVKPT
jgi:dehydrogenase/reductase SDR family member 7B